MNQPHRTSPSCRSDNIVFLLWVEPRGTNIAWQELPLTRPETPTTAPHPDKIQLQPLCRPHNAYKTTESRVLSKILTTLYLSTSSSPSNTPLMSNQHSEIALRWEDVFQISFSQAEDNIWYADVNPQRDLGEATVSLVNTCPKSLEGALASVVEADLPSPPVTVQPSKYQNGVRPISSTTGRQQYPSLSYAENRYNKQEKPAALTPVTPYDADHLCSPSQYPPHGDAWRYTSPARYIYTASCWYYAVQAAEKLDLPEGPPGYICGQYLDRAWERNRQAYIHKLVVTTFVNAGAED